MNNRDYYGLYGLILGGLVDVTIFLQSASADVRAVLIKEGGFVESLSAIGYFVGAILVILIRRKFIYYTYAAFILILFGLRELDFHNRFTTMSVSKIKFYVSPEVLLLEKVIAIAIVLLLLYILIRLIKTHFNGLINAIKKGEPSALGVGGGILLILITKTLDGLSRKLASVNIIVSDNMAKLVETVEEVFELGIPLMFIIAAAARFRTAR
ncbi:hypothetical protein Noc_0458 [Nitrosococcus oceani ATCC 19707]|uniref:Uncharacterized protein n=1 Tax=Nitrosococcus oceani (strain ATCC 19707 / BCRC 17464 / JCM 30415 / NCIMB 11848 / C-107) TaxID=323261 RepID=Q3JDW5_NITOC|nr:hypothetical protein Noc_0458 [Nitrosococcus oceani ATCC 19707]